MNRTGFRRELRKLLSDLGLLDPPKRTAWFVEIFGHPRSASRWLNKGTLPIQGDWDRVLRWMVENRSSVPDIKRRLAFLTELLQAERKDRRAKRRASTASARLTQAGPDLTATSGKSATDEAAALSYERFLADTRIAAHLTTPGGKRSLYLDEVYVHRAKPERIVLEEADRYQLRPKGSWLSIEGDAGHGKTSLLWFLAQELHRTYLRVFPVQALHLAADALGDLVDSLPNDGKPFFVLLDTLDLLVGIDDARLGGWVNDIRARGGFLITTCRKPERQVLEGYARSSHLLGLGRYEPHEARAAIERYVDQSYPRWSSSRKSAQIEFVWELLDSRRRIQDLTFEPLLLRMIFEAYVPNDIPPDINTQQIYNRFWEQRVLGDRKPISPELAHARSLLSRLIASHLYFETEGHAEQLSIDTVARLGQSDELVNPLSVMRGLVSSGVLRWWQMKESVGFFHQTFLEYAAAKAILECVSREERRERVDLLLTDLAQTNLFRIRNDD